MSEVVSSLTNAFTLGFVVTSMFGLGLGLTVGQIVEPLKQVRLVLLALLANFVIVPAVAYALTRILPLEQDLQIGLILFSAVAGAPLSIKATQSGNGDMRFAVGLIALQVIATVAYLPLVLPLLIPGVRVDTIAIAMPLILQILLPLGLGLLMNARYDEEAEMTRPLMRDISNICLALMLILNLSNVGSVLGLIGTGAILAVLLVIAVGLLAGYLLGGPEARTRRALAIGTGQRNFAAAFVIGGGNFADRPTVIVMLLAASLISIVIVMLVAGELGRRSKAAAAAGTAPAEPAPAERHGRGHPQATA
jgi:bile acid:Na+ symporter, BASS family